MKVVHYLEDLHRQTGLLIKHKWNSKTTFQNELGYGHLTRCEPDAYVLISTLYILFSDLAM